jgi:hypothetical protein
MGDSSSASILTKNFKDLGLSIPLIHSHGVGNQNFMIWPKAQQTV